MKKLIANVQAYFEYLQRECRLFCSVHFSEDTCARIQTELMTALAPHMIHSHPYCHFVKASGRQRLCMQNQKQILEALEGEDCLLHTCHSGVTELLYPVRCEKKSIRGFVAVSGYRTEEKEGADPLYGTLSMAPLPKELADTLIPPLCMMLEQLMLRGTDESESEFKLILSYLAENHARVSLDELCAHFGRSRSHISHLFKANAGLSLRAFCNGLRLADARVLLQSTHLSVTEVAYEVGFEDASYFIKLFREKYGVSPRKIRE